MRSSTCDLNYKDYITALASDQASICGTKLIVNNMDKVRNFFWQGGSTKRKYHLIKWTRIYKSKMGGLGVKDLRK
jgi:hypothetical protein